MNYLKVWLVVGLAVGAVPGMAHSQTSGVPNGARNVWEDGESAEARRQRRFQCAASAGALGVSREEIESICEVRFTGSGPDTATQPLLRGASPAPSGPPRWLRRPAPTFPDRALDRGVMRGSVELSCTVDGSGRLADCEIVRESPQGLGFGTSALRETRRALAAPRVVDGVPQSYRLSFDMTFVAQ
jgi:TonB family protein